MATTTYDTSTSEVLKALENPKFRWRTVGGVSGDTGIPDRAVREILQKTLASRLLSVISDSPK